MTDDWQAWQRQDELNRQQDILAALKVAEEAGVPREYIIVLAHEAGVGELYRSNLNRTERKMTCPASTK